MRYPLRPFFHPLGMMATNPVAYVVAVELVIFGICYIFRYNIADFRERMQETEDEKIRKKAIVFYSELDVAHRRQSRLMKYTQFNENTETEWKAQGYSEEIRRAGRMSEMNYWHAHQRDAARAELLLNEIRELKAKMSEGVEADAEEEAL